MIPLITNPVYSYSFNEKHRFPMEKFAHLTRYLTEKGMATPKNTFRPGRAKREALELAHSAAYLDSFIHNTQTKQEQRRMGLPWSEGLVKRTLISPNGTLLAGSLALQNGIACHLAGGTHHAHRDFASGFCILNDLAITALALLALKKCTKVLIFDCDVHQGDGTATILQHEPRVFTCSVHCEKNFPARKAKSDLDVELPKGMQDKAYLEVVTRTFETLIQTQQPDFILYDAGVDVYEHDPLGLLNITQDAIFMRDRNVLQLCRQHGIPVATVIGGGYDDDRIALARRHAIVTEAAFDVYGDV